MLCPRLNGTFDEVAKTLDTTFSPSEVKRKSNVYIMWTSSFTPVSGRKWLPNPFVPLENVNEKQFIAVDLCFDSDMKDKKVILTYCIHFLDNAYLMS